MNGNERRAMIMEMLLKEKRPLSGTYLSRILKVSRQVIVQDIAILRAESREIMATPQGYIIPEYPGNKSYKRVFACIHKPEDIEEELKIIVSIGGRVLDVMVEHPVYGELRGMLMLSSMYDVEEFTSKLKESVSQPLLVLTGGVHLHTVEVDNEKKLDMIEDKLRAGKFLLDSKSQ